jgi:hypothetical protein
VGRTHNEKEGKVEDTHEPSSHSGSVRLPKFTPGSQESFLPGPEGTFLETAFLVAMAITREPLLTPMNATCGHELKALLLLTKEDDLAMVVS